MAEQSVPPRTARFTDEELQAIERYQLVTMEVLRSSGGPSVSRPIATLRQGIGHLNDAERTQLAAACRSWRAALSTVPESPPAVYRTSHARLLQYLGTIADIGDALAEAAEAIEARDDGRIAVALREYDREMETATDAWPTGHAAPEETPQ
jgi:hypothetical protein